jgi:tetratricopeptide (TPR) repeat protein
MIRSWVFLLFLTARLPAQPHEADLDRLSEQARSALTAKNWSAAEKALRELARRAPAVPEVQANLGLALYFEGRPADAVTAFDRARELNPHLAAVELMVGLCDAELGRDRAAIELLAPAFEHPPDPETGRLAGLHLAHSYAALQQFDKAVAAGEELLRRYPDDAEILYQVARLDGDRSAALMTKLAHTAPDSAWTHYANGQVQEGLDRFGAAEQEYRKALERDPRLSGPHYRLGRVMLNAPRTPDSIPRAQSEFEQELAISPRNADAEFELGEIERERGNLDAALGHFERALDAHLEFEEAQVGIARVLLNLGRTAEAIPHLTVAARLDPGNKLPHYLLASAYKSLGNTAAAAQEIAVYKALGDRSH